jgi:hypothetical protein
MRVGEWHAGISLAVYWSIAGFSYPFDEWPSFEWELPLFPVFLGVAALLGITVAITLSARRRRTRSKIMSLSWSPQRGEDLN